MTFFPFRPVTLEPLEGFRRNLTQMFTRLRRCAEAMFWMAGSVCLSICPFCSVTLEHFEGFRRNLTQMLTTLRQHAEAMFRMARFKVKVILRKT